MKVNKTSKVDKFEKRAKEKHRRRRLDRYLEQAGYDLTQKEVAKLIAIASACSLLFAYITFSIYGFQYGWSIPYVLWIGFLSIVLGYPLVFAGVVVVLYLYTDVRILTRRTAIEKVLPQFLHLTSANVRAGMQIDEALWSAVRPQFGILSKEIEDVAKKNMVGKDLGEALFEFSDRYDSKLLTRTISIIVKGLDSGSEIGSLLEKIALNIEDLQMRRDSMVANITTYILFISIAVMFAAPFLFAISMQMLRIAHSLGGSIGDSAGSVNGMSFSLSTDAVNETDFFIFCITALTLTTIMSSVIISGIKTGHALDALKSIPIKLVVTLLVFMGVQMMLNNIFGSIF